MFIKRQNIVEEVALVGALSDTINIRTYATGTIRVEDWNAATLAFKHAMTEDASFQPLYDNEGNLVTISIEADKDFVLPKELYATAFIKLWSETDSSDVEQDTTATLFLKG